MLVVCVRNPDDCNQHYDISLRNARETSCPADGLTSKKFKFFYVPIYSPNMQFTPLARDGKLCDAHVWAYLSRFTGRNRCFQTVLFIGFIYNVSRLFRPNQLTEWLVNFAFTETFFKRKLRLLRPCLQRRLQTMCKTAVSLPTQQTFRLGRDLKPLTPTPKQRFTLSWGVVTLRNIFQML